MNRQSLALMLGWAVLIGAAPAASDLPLRPLTVEDVGDDALRNAACYAHDGPHVLLVAAERNAVVNSDGDLRLLQRGSGPKPLARGARYMGSEFEITVSATGDVVPDSKAAGRVDGAAELRVSKKGVVSSSTARWNCRLQG
jgi:hypothetical protein